MRETYEELRERLGNKPVIPMEELVVGAVYRLWPARNIFLGVWDGRGFIGIRYKFGYRLDTEYHGQGEAFPTAWPRELLGHMPEGMRINERMHDHSVDSVTGRPVAFDRPISSGGRGWYFLDTNEASEAIRATSYENKELFDALWAFAPEEHAAWAD